MAALTSRWDIRRTDAPDGTVAGTLARIIDGRGEISGTDLPTHMGAFSSSDVLQLLTEDPRLMAVMQGLLDLEVILLADTLRRVATAGGEPARPHHLDIAQAFVVLAQGWQAQWMLPRPAPIEVVINAARSLAVMTPGEVGIPPGDRGQGAAALPERWAPPHPVDDIVRDAALDPARLASAVSVDGLDALPDLAHLDALRTTGAGGDLLVVARTGDMEEVEPLARVTLGVWCRLIRQAAPESCWPGVAVVIDTDGSITASLTDPQRATA
jgi:hypothetical protein